MQTAVSPFADTSIVCDKTRIVRDRIEPVLDALLVVVLDNR